MVYKARQTSLDRIVAIKELKPAFSSIPELKTRFEREAKTSASLQHENIIQILNFGGGTKTQPLFMVMEYVQGVDLSSIVKHSGPLPVHIARLMIHELIRAIAYAHRRELIHRDIKPSNVMLSIKGEIKLMDFGIVRAVESDLTQTGAMLGTPSYMSPEQIVGEKLTPATDIFSLGVLAYEILTGVKPFIADDDSSLIEKIRKERETPPRHINPEIPRKLQNLVCKCLEKKPERRPMPEDLLREIKHGLKDRDLTQAPDLIAHFLEDSGVLQQDDSVTRVVKGTRKEPIIQTLKETEKPQATPKKTAKPAKTPTKKVPQKEKEIPQEQPEAIPFPVKWIWRLIMFIIISLSAAIIYILYSPGTP